MHLQRLYPDHSLPYVKFRRMSAWAELHNEAVTCVKNLKIAYRELLATLIKIEDKQVYYQLDSTSLHDYLVDVLQLPNHTAYDFNAVVKTSKEFPALADAVIANKTTITKARRICSLLTRENQDEWIQIACQGTLKEIQRAVAKANPRAAIPETLTFISGDTLQLTFAVSEDWATLLSHVKDLLSQKEKRAVSTEEALFTLMAQYKTKHDPVLKAERAKVRTKDKSIGIQQAEAGAAQPGPFQPGASQQGASRARYIPMSVEHEVDLRDENQCTYVDQNGRRCSTKRWLEKHHVVEFAKGGSHTAHNLETLCSAHHRIRHLRRDTKMADLQ